MTVTPNCVYIRSKKKTKFRSKNDLHSTAGVNLISGVHRVRNIGCEYVHVPMRCVTISHQSSKYRASPNYWSLKNRSATVVQFYSLQLRRWYWSTHQVPWAPLCGPGLLGCNNKNPCRVVIVATSQALISSRDLCIAMDPSPCSTRAANQRLPIKVVSRKSALRRTTS